VISYLIAAAIMQGAPTPNTTTPDINKTTDAQLCEEMHFTVANTTREMPRMVNATTRADGVAVDCGLRVFSWQKTFMGDEASSSGQSWQAFETTQFNRQVCDISVFRQMIRRGWRFVEYLSFRNGERVKVDAAC
jgi:hypothetical protein